VLDDDEAVFGVLEGGDQDAADQTEDDDVTAHRAAGEKYIRGEDGESCGAKAGDSSC